MRLLNGVNESVGKVVLGPNGGGIPMETMNAAAIARLMYNANPEEYAKLVKAPLVAHLTNNVPVIEK